MKKLLYSILNLFTLGKGMKRYISGFLVRMPTRYFRYFTSDYELNNINFLNNTLSVGMVAIDIGAHIGLLSIIMAKKVGNNGKVISCEPTPSTFKILKETIKINNVKDIVIPLQKAVSQEKGKMSFYVTNIQGHNSNSLADTSRKHVNEHKIDVDVVTIDNISEIHQLVNVDLIKIDAEGAEYSVLKGAIKTINKNHPKIILALHPTSINDFGDTLSEIWDFIIKYDYKVIYNHDEINKDFFINQKDLFDVFLI